MTRDITKTLDAYYKLKDKNRNMGDFYLADIQQIYDKAQSNIFMAINYALEFGYMTGYRRGKKERKGV